MNGTIIIPALSVIATIVAAVMRAPKRLVGLTILPALLVVVQMLINLVGGHGNDHSTSFGLAILGLHALNGLIIMFVARMVFMQARALLAPAKAVAAVDEVNAADAAT
jgi:hypothetical protein